MCLLSPWALFAHHENEMASTGQVLASESEVVGRRETVQEALGTLPDE